MLDAAKTRLHQLVDALPERTIEAANEYLERLINGFGKKFIISKGD